MTQLHLVTLVVEDYDTAIRFFVDILGFVLVTDKPAYTNDGRPKRWVEVKPPNGETGLLLAKADGAAQVSVIGQQTAGRVGFFLKVDDFDALHARLVANRVPILRGPRTEEYGRVLVFPDIAGNLWDLIGP